MTLTTYAIMFDASTPIGTFLTAAAAKQPTPGGGSVTALAGALAATMGEMTLNYSVGKKGLEAHQDILAPALCELTHAREVLVRLMIEDQARSPPSPPPASGPRPTRTATATSAPHCSPASASPRRWPQPASPFSKSSTGSPTR